MGGNTGRGIAGAGGGSVPNTTPPATGAGTTYTNTQYGKEIRDSAYSQAQVYFTDNNNYPQTTKQIDNLIRHTGIPSDFAGRIEVTGRRDGSVGISISGDGVSMTRSIQQDITGKTYVYNQYFRIDEGTKYDGRGWEIFNNQVRYVSSNNSIAGNKPSYIKVDAAGNGPALGSSSFNGYYTWLRFGYKPNSIDDARITRMYNQGTGSNARNAREMMSSKAGRDWWQQNGNSWGGTFDLTKGSESRKVLAQYARERAKKKNK